MFLLLCILAMFAIHAITQIASKTEKLWAAKKHHHNFAFWCGMLCEDLSRRYTLSGDTTPQSFRLVKQAENPAPLTQGSRDSRSVSLCKHRGAAIGAAVRAPSTLRVQCIAYFLAASATGGARKPNPQREPRRLPPRTTEFTSEGAKWVPQIPPRCSNSRTVRKACPPVLKACSPVLKAYLPMLKAQKIPCSK